MQILYVVLAVFDLIFAAIGVATVAQGLKKDPIKPGTYGVAVLVVLLTINAGVMIALALAGGKL